METLILASSSPRRRSLLHKITDAFSIKDPICEEITDGDPQTVAETNAVLKGRAVDGDFVLACDTVVAMDGRIFGKPQDESHAVEMLSALNGKTHLVISGVYVRFHGQETVFSDKTEVTFKNLTEEKMNVLRESLKQFKDNL